MRINIYLEERFLFLNGIYYSQIYNNDFWVRYLNIYPKISVVARVNKINNINDIPDGYKPTTLDNVSFSELPNYKGLFFSFISLPYLLVFLFILVLKSNRNILRLPGMISIIAGFFCIFLNKKFAVELVGDPYEVFSAGVGGKISKLLRFIFTYSTKKIIKKSNAVAYVTRVTMQSRYTASNKAFTTHYSSIILDSSIILKEKNITDFDEVEKFNILMVGSLEQRYKGFDLVLEAYHKIKNNFQNIKIYIIGDGIYKQELVDLATKLQIQHQVYFLGKMSREKVLETMDQADLFIMPSRTEGLPRALIEAMARGVPAIGSKVGGIPELLNDEFLFEKENITELTKLLLRVIPDKILRMKMSQLNIEIAKEYRSELLESRRNKFYSYLASE